MGLDTPVLPSPCRGTALERTEAGSEVPSSFVKHPLAYLRFARTTTFAESCKRIRLRGALSLARWERAPCQGTAQGSEHEPRRVTHS